MKQFLVIAFSLVSLATYAQTEVSKGQSTTASQSTRLRLGADATNMGQSDNAGVFKPFALKEEAFLRSMPVTAADTTAPSAGFVKLTVHPITNRIGQKRAGANQKNEPFALSSELNQVIQALYSTATSVNNVTPDQSGNVAITTNDIPEGTTNKYYTDAKVTAVGDARYAPLASTIPLSIVPAYSNLSGVTAPTTGIKFVQVSTDERYSEVNSLYLVAPGGKILKLQTLKEN